MSDAYHRHMQHRHGRKRIPPLRPNERARVEEQRQALLELPPDVVKDHFDALPAYTPYATALAAVRHDLFQEWVNEVEAGTRIWYARIIDPGQNPGGIVARTWRYDGAIQSEQMFGAADLDSGAFKIEPNAAQPGAITVVFDGDDGNVIAVLDARRWDADA